MIGFCGGTLIKTVDQVFLTDCGEAQTFCLESKTSTTSALAPKAIISGAF